MNEKMRRDRSSKHFINHNLKLKILECSSRKSDSIHFCFSIFATIITHSMIRILANYGIQASAKSALEKEGFEVITEKIPQEELANRINEFDVLTVRSATKVRKPLIDVITKTELIIRGGVGLDNIDVEYAQS